MGGIGSGRYHFRERECVEDNRSIDVNRLKREGCLDPGWRGNWQWRREEKVVAWIGMAMGETGLQLSYRWRIRGGEWRDIEQTVPIVMVPCRLGGDRPYFRCCGVVNDVACQKRVVRLYGAGPYFLCRHCYRLAYATQSENQLDRTFTRANRLRQRLGGEPGLDALLPKRPKGMWRRTYTRMLERVLAADEDANTAFIEGSRRILRSIDQRKGKESFW